MRNKTKAFLLQAPALLLLIAAFIGSIVIKMAALYPITWGTPVMLALILAAYFWGKYFEKKATHEYY